MSNATAFIVVDMLVTTSVWDKDTSSSNGITYGSKIYISNYFEEIMA